MHIIICVRWNRERKKRERPSHKSWPSESQKENGLSRSGEIIPNDRLCVCECVECQSKRKREREHSSGCFSSITGVSFSLRLLFWIVPSATRGRRCTWWVGSFSSQNNKLCHLFLHLLLLIQSWYIFLGIWNAVEQEEEEEEKQKGVRDTTPLCLCGNVTAI
jgi:hypothetical protein